MINFDDINEVKKALEKTNIQILRLQIKSIQLENVIKSHEEGIYNPGLYNELMKRSK